MKLLYSFLWVMVALLSVPDLSAQPVTTPDAPDLVVSYLDGVMTLTISNDNPSSNNFEENFAVVDPLLPEDDNQWLFQGYLVYQIQLGFNELDFYDPEVARLVAQVDIEDEQANLINNQYDTDLGMCVPGIMVEGGNSGIQHEFNIDEDLWTNEPFIEGEIYCYTVLAYASHPEGFNPDCDDLAYQFIRSQQSANGSLELQCKTAQNPMNIIKEFNNAFLSYPNPTTTGHVLFSDVWDIEIFDLSGQKLKDFRDASNIYVGHLPNGVYFARLLDNTGQCAWTDRIVVAKSASQ